MLEALKTAKELSDAGDYDSKERILRFVMLERPGEFVVDSPEGPHPGITHLPTGFRLHTTRNSIPNRVWANSLKAAHERDAAEEQEAKRAAVLPQVVAPSGKVEPLTGPQAIRRALEKLDLDREEQRWKAAIATRRSVLRGPAVKALNSIQGLKRNGLKPVDLIITKVPVVPPSFRPFTRVGTMFQPGDANELYAEVINMRDLAEESMKQFGQQGAGQEVADLYGAVRAVYGYGDPVSARGKQRQLSGFLQAVLGTSPKMSWMQRKMLSKPLDQVSRGAITVDPELSLDEIGIPEDMAWEMYSNYVQRRLVRSGIPMLAAKKHVVDRSPLAMRHLMAEIPERLVMYSRAPAWHKFNNLAGQAKLIKGNQIAINPLVTTGMTADFDGDTINLHVPATQAAMEDAKNKLLPSKMLMSIKDPEQVVPALKHELLLGLSTAQTRPARQKHVFGSRQEALSAVQSGRISYQDEVEFPGSERFG